jgi:ATP-dependent RNA helicase DDX54/DBP10
VAFDLTNDEAASMAQKRRQSQVKWDRKKKKFVKGDGIGADNVKLIKTESGTKLPSTYKSGRYEEWKSKNHRSDLKVGEMERNSNTYNPSKRAGMADRFKHSKKTEAKPLDKLTYDYERKMRVMKKKEGATFGEQQPERGRRSPGGKGGKAAGARWKGKSPGQVKNELRTVHEIRKQRNVAEKRRAKNARAPKKGKGRR